MLLKLHVQVYNCYLLRKFDRVSDKEFAEKIFQINENPKIQENSYVIH